jgi:FtsZ-interacting cell division protein ZipA
VILVIMLLMVIPAVILRILWLSGSEKRKRFAEGQDMYSLIDRMVDELDDDELDYLHRRLEEREQKPKHELAESLDDLLTWREDDRSDRRR